MGDLLTHLCVCRLSYLSLDWGDIVRDYASDGLRAVFLAGSLTAFSTAPKS